MKLSTVIGGGIIFVTGIATGMCLVCKAAVKIDEKIYKGKLREKFVEATTETTTSFIHEKFEPKRFEPKRFEYRRFNNKLSYHALKDVIFASWTEAEEIRLALNDLIEKYGQVSISDFYDLVDVNYSYLDTKYGWKEGLSDELITTAKDGWSIDFPDVLEL